MIRLLLGRFLPAALAVGIFTSALSPLRPALQAFGTAAAALTGADAPGPAEEPGLPAVTAALAPPGSLAGAQKRGADVPSASERRKRLLDLAARLKDPNAPKVKEFEAPRR